MSTCEARVRPMTLSARSLALAFGAGLGLLFAAPAAASPAFPSVLQEEYDMPCAPSCTLCHATDPGQAGNFVKPFAIMAVVPASGGGLAGDESKLKTALAAIQTNQTDTDGDGASDYTELSEGNDPNVPGDVRLCGPAYGCGAHIARSPAKNGGAWILAACAAALVTFGFRRRRSE